MPSHSQNVNLKSKPLLYISIQPLYMHILKYNNKNIWQFKSLILILLTNINLHNDTCMCIKEIVLYNFMVFTKNRGSHGCVCKVVGTIMLLKVASYTHTSNPENLFLFLVVSKLLWYSLLLFYHIKLKFCNTCCSYSWINFDFWKKNAWISKKIYGWKWTWEIIQHYTWTQIEVKEQHFHCCSTFHSHKHVIYMSKE